MNLTLLQVLNFVTALVKAGILGCDLYEIRILAALSADLKVGAAAWELRNMSWKRIISIVRLLCTTLAIISLESAAAFARTNYAVVVAATSYPNLPPKSSLVGPNNDAALIRDYLTKNSPVPFAPENITLLADNMEGGSTPTHAAIQQTFAKLARKVVEGDFVYLHFSGHGSQQPEMKVGNETDGLDEIFLPADTGQWKNRAAGVPNALVDDEIGASLDALRNAGAFVWFVIDACNSGTATRAAPVGEDTVTERKLDPADLGIPAAEMTTAGVATARGMDNLRESAIDAAAVPTGATAIKKGGLVSFYAAQTIETTPEMPLPKGAASAQKFGLFTFTIFSKLAENPNMTYRQLGAAILQQYGADGRSRPTPLFEGDLDARVFGMEKLDTVMQWPIEMKENSASIQAGILHRLAPGTKLAILPSPASELSETLGYMEVRSAKNLSSQVAPIAFDGKSALKLAEVPAGAYLRLSELAVDFKLKVSRPAALPGLEYEVRLVNSALDRLVGNTDKRFNVALVEPAQEADIRLAILRESEVARDNAPASDRPALFFLPTSGELSISDNSRPPLVVIDAAAPDKLSKGLEDNLVKIFRATSLSRLAAASDYRPEEVSVEFQIKREADGRLEPLDGAAVPVVNPGDQVHILAKNNSSKLVDINILYVGSDYSITHISAQRLVSGAKIEEALLAFSDSSFGMERMIAVLTEAPALSEIEDLKFLEQGGVPPVTRSAGSTPGFSQMLSDIGMAPATRSAMKLGTKDATKGGVLIFPVETIPRRN
ncbi:caspase family protein [Mesorhizobium sp. VNQ89]|uniref:caspase family protein n=1 Tax=Mesorhizobium quangtriensis TaxID=3157709 RepID=UPI0032B7F65F